MTDLLIPLPTDWQLYSTMKGVDEANRAIAAAVTKVAHEYAKLEKSPLGLSEKAIRSIAKAKIGSVLRTYRRFGAWDGEPAETIADYLGRYITKVRQNDAWGHQDHSNAIYDSLH